MKDQENKKSKKKVLMYYLILAACLLVIAAVTVTVIFTVGRPSNKLGANTDQTETDKGDKKPDDGKNDDDNKGDDNKGDNSSDDNKGDNSGDDNKDDSKPTVTPSGFALPVTSASVSVSYEFAYDETLDRYCVHKGMDFEGTAGDNVYAIEGGTITNIVVGSVLDGNYITITHDGGVTSTYKFIDVKEGLEIGAKVKRGDIIGTIASASGTEMSQGDHLHLEMTAGGKAVDPNNYLNIAEK